MPKTKKKYAVWLPNTLRNEPHIIHADEWNWRENSQGNGSRLTFSIGERKVAIIVGDCAVFEVEEG